MLFCSSESRHRTLITRYRIVFIVLIIAILIAITPIAVFELAAYLLYLQLTHSSGLGKVNSFLREVE